MQNENIKIKTNKIERIFNPKSVAVIGATDRPGSVGRGLCKNLLEGKKKRKIYFVNPYKTRIFGYKTYPKITDIQEKIDLAIIAVPSPIVLQVTKDCAKKQVEGVIIISAGFAEIGKKGKKLQGKIAKVLQEKSISLIGPNCLGIIKPKISLNASFSLATPQAGGIAFVSQSGALIDAVIDISLAKNYGFSAIISYGNGAGLKLYHFLDFLAKDKETKVIALYIEGLKEGREFIKAAKKISQTKPIIALKAGKTKMGAKSVSSHTGSLAGSAKIYSTAFRQAGIIEVNSLQDLLETAKALAWQPQIKNGIGIITNGGGAGVLATDYAQESGIELPGLARKTKATLKSSKKMSPAMELKNPLDIIGDALSDRYKIAIETLLSQQNINGLIIIQTLQIMTEAEKNAKIIVEAKKKYPKKAIITTFMGGKLSQKAIEILEKNRIPNYIEPKMAIKAIKALIR